jgi:hypothetical protein
MGERFATNFFRSAILAIISGAILAGMTSIAEFTVFRFVAGASAFTILAVVPVSNLHNYLYCLCLIVS